MFNGLDTALYCTILLLLQSVHNRASTEDCWRWERLISATHNWNAAMEYYENAHYRVKSIKLEFKR